MAFALLREIFAAVGSLITIPKWLIQRVLRPSRNFWQPREWHGCAVLAFCIWVAARPAINPRIQDLPSATFYGKQLTRGQITGMIEMVRACSGLSRTELGLTDRLRAPAVAGRPGCRPRAPGHELHQARHGLFSHSLRTASQHVEWLLLRRSAALSTTVESIPRSMDSRRERERPNRSYPRVTRRPNDRWRSSKKM